MHKHTLVYDMTLTPVYQAKSQENRKFAYNRALKCFRNFSPRRILTFYSHIVKFPVLFQNYLRLLERQVFRSWFFRDFKLRKAAVVFMRFALSFE